MLFRSVTWIEIGGTTYKLGGFVIVASDLFPEFAHIVDIVVSLILQPAHDLLYY